MTLPSAPPLFGIGESFSSIRGLGLGVGVMREGFPLSRPKEARETLYALESYPRGFLAPGVRDGRKVGLGSHASGGPRACGLAEEVGV